MGRRPNPLILQYFERGEKLNDNSNRYHHRCRVCGEDFPKGRIDSLTTHLTKKCPAMSDAEKMEACLSLNGYGNGAGKQKFDGLLHSGPNTGPNTGSNTGPNPAPPSLSLNQWTPLETLAEVSRQIEANEKQDDHAPTAPDPTSQAVQTTLAAAVPTIAAPGSGQFEPHEQFTLENLPIHYDSGSHHEKRGVPSGFAAPEDYLLTLLADSLQKDVSAPESALTSDERFRQLFESVDQSAISVAAAATARLNPSLLDPQLIPEQVLAESDGPQAQSSDMMIDYPESEETPASAPATAPALASAPSSATASVPTLRPGPVSAPVPEPTSNADMAASTWGSMVYMPDDIHAPAMVNDHGQHLAATLSRGGHRMDTVNGPTGPRPRNSRARFETSRRKEVQEVRRIGACIRCRILRKTCSAGTPCDTCKKVLSPRVWRTGCVRTKLSEYIDLYSAGVQAVMAQKRVNNFKNTYHLKNLGVVVEASHFPETGNRVVFQVLQGHPRELETPDVESESPGPVILLDSMREDVPGKIEGYMRRILPELIRREPSPYIRVALEAADQVAKEHDDELLKRSLELWGIVEMMDRERQWTMLTVSPDEAVKDEWIQDEAGNQAYSNICMQLTAAAERKASVASRNLLNGIQRNLQDGKTKLGFPMFLTVMLFLNCVEKTTWAFKAWDEENLRPKWPLEKPPSNYTNQGHGLTELLRMLLVIRHILPKTNQADPDEPIAAAEEENLVVRHFFHDLNVTPAYLRTRYLGDHFQPTDSRSLEFLFCGPLLLHSIPPPPGSSRDTPMHIS
ncbi:hypothetical protein GGR56DRAFT_672640 [Xylariaceae sp. FL0804]|nr:hypothetical protein GGR56DRAFT_672640 [Xylariaceae sp. FL0804]